jgi:hypothetical protein
MGTVSAVLRDSLRWIDWAAIGIDTRCISDERLGEDAIEIGPGPCAALSGSEMDNPVQSDSASPFRSDEGPGARAACPPYREGHERTISWASISMLVPISRSGFAYCRSVGGAVNQVPDRSDSAW